MNSDSINAPVFAALTDETRRAMIGKLSGDGPASVGEIAGEFSIPPHPPPGT